MEYKKKYNDALDWMRKIYPTLTGANKEDAEHYFPELKESEDERIRKAIGAAICGTTAISILEANGTNLSDALSYIERQKEVNYLGIKISFSAAYNIVYDAGYLIISEEDYKEHLEEIRIFAYNEGIVDTKKKYEKEHQPAEWSEEEEERLNSIIESYKALLKDYKAYHDVDYIPYNSNTVIRNVVDDVNFLKSLRPQHHWKPSEEQMRCLLDCVSKAKEIHNASVGGYDAYRILVSLYNDLQKLL